MKKFLIAVLALMMSMSIFTACSTDTYTVPGVISRVGDIFRSDSIEGTWTLSGAYEDGEYAGVDSSSVYDLYGGFPEITFCEDGTILEYIPYDECEYENGYWEESGDGYYTLYDSMLGDEAVVDGGKLYITGWFEGYATVYSR